jgi:hypothetical protein
MRIRASETEVQYYAKAKRDNQIVRLQGSNWRVLGVTADHVDGQQQWWIELIEA